LNGRRSALGAGLRSLSQWRLILLLTLATVLLGVTAAMPLWPALDSAFGGTLAGDHILRNHPTFAPTDALDFLREKSAAIAAARQAMRWSALVGVVLQMFFAGGIVATLGRPAPFEWSGFFARCRSNVWHNFKCFLFFAVLVLVLPGLWLVGTTALGEKLFDEAPPWSDARLAYQIGTWAVGLLLFAVLSLVYDFARAARRNDPAIGAWRALRSAPRALSGAWLRGLGLVGFWFVAGGAVVLALFCLEWSGSASSWGGIAVHTFLQSIVLASRSAVRVGAWGSELALFGERLPVVAAGL
jgi:hypothetical protein